MSLSEFLYQGADLPYLDRVQTGGRLVKDDDRRIMNDCLGDAGALLIAPGKISDQSRAHLFQSATGLAFSNCNGQSRFFQAA